MTNAIRLYSVLFRLFVSPSLIFVFFRFLATRWQDTLEILTSSVETNNYIFGAIFRIPLPLISKNKVVHQMAGFWMINSHFREF